MDIGGSSASPPDSTPSRTGNSFNQTRLDFNKGDFNAICAFSGTVMGTDLSLTDVHTVNVYADISLSWAPVTETNRDVQFNFHAYWTIW